MLPQDPNMLMSFVNMKLRDEYESLEQLCDDLDIDQQALMERLSAAGYEYNKEYKKFW